MGCIGACVDTAEGGRSAPCLRGCEVELAWHSCGNVRRSVSMTVVALVEVSHCRVASARSAALRLMLHNARPATCPGVTFALPSGFLFSKGEMRSMPTAEVPDGEV